MGTWSYAYDALSNLMRQTDAKGQRICLYYDALNRLTGKHYRADDACPTSNRTLPVSYSYDANAWGKGRRTGMVDASGSTVWSYDNRGRVTSETKTVKDGATVLGTYTTSWTYTNADQVKKMTYPSGEEVTSNYLPQGTLTSLTSSYNLTYLSSAAVDAAGRPTVFNLGNGTQTVYTYNAWNAADGQAGRLQKLQSGSPDSLTAGVPNLQSLQYVYDWAGNITRIGDELNANQSQCFTYDVLNRLTRATTKNDALHGCTNTGDLGVGNYDESYTYNATTGNLQTKGASGTYEYDPAHPHAVQKLAGVVKYGYDANGNQISRVVGGVTYTLAYDQENRLTQISASGSPTYDYVYDGDGQRVLVKQSTGDKTIYIGGYFEVFIKTIYTAPATPPARNCGAMRCLFVPSVTTLATSPAPARQIWKSYYSTGAGRVLRVKDNTNTGGVSGIFYLYADHLGSTTVTARMDAIGGDLLSTLSYTAWGETRASNGATPTNMRYTGQREAEAGLYFYQARWYDPALGRFAQADTIIPGPDAQAFDRYMYTRNNPLRYSDPSGHYACGDGIDDPRCEQDSPSYETYILFFGGTLGEGLIGEPVGSDEDEAKLFTARQSPPWVAKADITIPYPGSKLVHAQLAIAALKEKYGDKKFNLVVVGYSGGADSALIFADMYDGPGNIKDMVLLGPTFSGKMPGNTSLDKEWTRILDKSLARGINVLVVDDSVKASDKAVDYLSKQGAKGIYFPLDVDNQNHYTTTCNSVTFTNLIFSILSYMDMDRRNKVP